MASDQEGEGLPEGLHMSLDQIIQKKRGKGPPKAAQDVVQEPDLLQQVDDNVEQFDTNMELKKSKQNRAEGGYKSNQKSNIQSNVFSRIGDKAEPILNDNSLPIGYDQRDNSSQQYYGSQNTYGNTNKIDYLRKVYEQRQQQQDQMQTQKDFSSNQNMNRSFNFDTDFYNAPLKAPPREQQFNGQRNSFGRNNYDRNNIDGSILNRNNYDRNSLDKNKRKFNSFNRNNKYSNQQQNQKQFKYNQGYNQDQAERKLYGYRKLLQSYKKDNGEVAVKFHDTEIVKVNLDGDVAITTGGYKTVTTHLALNDVLNLIDIKISAENNDPVKGEWKLVDGKSLSRYYDNMVVKGRGPSTYKRATTIFDFFQKPNFKELLAANKKSGGNEQGQSQFQSNKSSYNKGMQNSKGENGGMEDFMASMQNMNPLVMAAMMNPYMMMQMQQGGGQNSMSMFNNYNNQGQYEEQNVQEMQQGDQGEDAQVQ